MSDIIDFLERLGREAQWRAAPRAEIERLLQDEGVNPDMRAAVAAGDPGRIQSLLGATKDFCCLIYMPREGQDDTVPHKVEQPVPGEEELIPAYSNRRAASGL